jgi:Zn-dependent protease with chaperone function
LSAGGKVVAESLGGQLLAQNSQDLNQRKLLNVVEEMAIASGTPVPPVYLLVDEPGINAFAAGFSPRDAVIGVTQGAIEHLNREQLQGVIAHEFSHIFNRGL